MAAAGHVDQKGWLLDESLSQRHLMIPEGHGQRSAHHCAAMGVASQPSDVSMQDLTEFRQGFLVCVLQEMLDHVVSIRMTGNVRRAMDECLSGVEELLSRAVLEHALDDPTGVLVARSLDYQVASDNRIDDELRAMWRQHADALLQHMIGMRASHGLPHVPVKFKRNGKQGLDIFALIHGALHLSAPLGVAGQLPDPSGDWDSRRLAGRPASWAWHCSGRSRHLLASLTRC
mmetsp:Transcript_18325/g.29285  ORF Transcript_18325/g.29285 Transcript_18325/m.29285 type:complete len:231 (+) Transcript_18325:1339-2031(+)